MDEVETKVCLSCFEEKPITDFKWASIPKQLRATRCRECFRDIERHYKPRRRVVNQTRKAEIISRFKEGKRCLFCEENTPVCLDFHHTDPSTKETTLANLIHRGYSIERIEREVKKCVLICSNCHRKVHAGLLTVPTDV